MRRWYLWLVPLLLVACAPSAAQPELAALRCDLDEGGRDNDRIRFVVKQPKDEIGRVIVQTNINDQGWRKAFELQYSILRRVREAHCENYRLEGAMDLYYSMEHDSYGLLYQRNREKTEIWAAIGKGDGQFDGPYQLQTIWTDNPPETPPPSPKSKKPQKSAKSKAGRSK